MPEDDRALHNAGQRTQRGRLNTSVWGHGGFVRSYRSHRLRAPERLFVSHYDEDLRGAVLELGCGGGRITGHLVARASSLRAMDIGRDMVDHCRRAYPGATFEVGDIRDLSHYETASADVIVAGFNLTRRPRRR